MENLNHYVKQKNLFRKAFGNPLYVLPRDGEQVRMALEADLSPENISCDGERPFAEVQRLRRFYTQCLRELDRVVVY